MQTKTILAASLVLALSGCASLPPSMGGGYQSSADRYNAEQAQQAQRVQLGTVVDVRRVDIAASSGQTATGSVVGALIGGLAGHQIGGGNGKTAATAIGAVAGAVAGNRVGAKVYQQPGVSITVKLDGGQLLQITQAADVQLTAGQRVQIITGGYGRPARVIPVNSL